MVLIEDLNMGGAACGEISGGVGFVVETGGTDNPGTVGSFWDIGRVAESGVADGFEMGVVVPAAGTVTEGLPTSLIGKLGGILISGVSGLAVSSIAFSEGGGPLGFIEVSPLGEDEDGGGFIDPGTGGFISSAICRRF